MSTGHSLFYLHFAFVLVFVINTDLTLGSQSFTNLLDGRGPERHGLKECSSSDCLWEDQQGGHHLQQPFTRVDGLEEAESSDSTTTIFGLAPEGLNGTIVTVVAPEDDFEQLDTYLPHGYNMMEIPAPPKNETADDYRFRVWVSLTIKSVLEMDELKERIALEMETVISWTDYHIRKTNCHIMSNTTTALDLEYWTRLWTPDLYMENSVHMGRAAFIGEPVSLRLLAKTGEIFYKTRLTPTVLCRMTFLYYPADTQKCQFTLRSYSYQSHDLALLWRRIVKLNDEDVANFELHIETSVKRSNVTEKFDVLDLTYDTVEFTLIARRKLSYHIVQTYFPSSLFIVITWFCFLLPPSTMLEARMTLSITTLLTLTAMFASVRQNAPVVSYIKAIDIWMAGCILFVFMALGEFTAIVWIRSRNQRKYVEAPRITSKEIPEEQLTDASHVILEVVPEGPPSTQMESRPRFRHWESNSSLKKSKSDFFGGLIEKYAGLAYSMSFLTFSIVYWTWLLLAANYFEIRRPTEDYNVRTMTLLQQ